MRQRRAMRQLLCQVCGGPADQTEAGVLWLLQDHREDWTGWPEAMAVTEPPICLSCARLSIRLCPALRKGAVTVRAKEYPLVGIHGQLYTGPGPLPTAVGKAVLAFESPAARWILATGLVRQLRDCRFVSA
nr:Phage protein [Kibdelosporangium sp. MJ126-NF4]CTQ92994.1 Phage protein [Kibdelosporangium sp. MJ126-NF4]